MSTEAPEQEEAEFRRLLRAHLLRLGEQVIRLSQMSPVDRLRDEAVIRIAQPATRRVSLVQGGDVELREAALALAACGLRVFPVGAATFNVDDRSNGKTPLIKGWPQRATTDAATIIAWWADEFSGANIGIATGAGSGITIVDLDHRPDEGKDGPGQLAALEREHGDLPRTPTSRRGLGGHLYFAYVAGLSSTNGALPGVDVKNDGGYVVAPPSLHRSGARYRWVVELRDQVPPPMPAWLVAALTPAAKSARSPVRPTTGGMVRDGKIEKLIDAIRDTLTVDDVLDARGLAVTPCVCPLHEGADNPAAFTSYSNGTRWHCFTRCADGENGGDVIDLIQRLDGCGFRDALKTAVQLAEPSEGLAVDDAVERGGGR
jgi:hypothetical protein